MKIRRIIVCVLVLSFIIHFSSYSMPVVNADDYIEIYTAEDLYNIRNNLSGYYKLMNDIDLSEVTASGGLYDFNGCGWNPIGSNNSYSNTAFTGVFDGQGYTIKGLRIEISDIIKQDANIGLFSNNNGVIKNINIDHPTIKWNIAGNVNCGCIAAENGGTISNVNVKDATFVSYIYMGELHAINSYQYKNVGYTGTVAGINKGIIENSYGKMNSNSHANGGYTYRREKIGFSYIYTSGIATNVSSSSQINNCYSEGINVDSIDYDQSFSYRTAFADTAGIGFGVGVFRNCYSLMEDADYGISDKGQIITCYYTDKGKPQESSGSATNCYYITGKGTAGTGWIGLNELQMQNADFFEGFDFNDIWAFSDSSDYKYPTFRFIIDREIANNVKSLIEALPEATDVTTADKQTIEEARAAYDSLTDTQKQLVDTSLLNKLTDVEAALVAAQEAEQKEQNDNAAATNVIDLINNLPVSSDVTTADKQKIEEARAAYDSLSDDQKKLVNDTILNKLIDSETALKNAQEAANKGSSDKKDKKDNKTNNKTNKYSNEWIKGRWYDKNGKSTYQGILKWKKNSIGWWVEDTKGWYPKSQWQKIDGLWYYFNSSGYMASSEWIDGWWCNSDGSCTYKGVGSWHSHSKGWWYGDSTGWYAKNQWQKVDNNWYYFNSSGYMVTNTYIDGYWIGANGVCQ